MSEWLKEHAWKAKRASQTEPLRRASTHTRSATQASTTITQCASVNLDVLRGFEPDLSQCYHNRVAHLLRVARRASVLVQTRDPYSGRRQRDGADSRDPAVRAVAER